MRLNSFPDSDIRTRHSMFGIRKLGPVLCRAIHIKHSKLVTTCNETWLSLSSSSFTTLSFTVYHLHTIQKSHRWEWSIFWRTCSYVSWERRLDYWLLNISLRIFLRWWRHFCWWGTKTFRPIGGEERTHLGLLLVRSGNI